ncbi:MAG TPA: DUF4199 domain-containing protein [Lentimicrobium sp.]|jgi:hypothetical protein|nr:DUF4199 domain-containing protein [Lentimicrobium sp.]
MENTEETTPFISEIKASSLSYAVKYGLIISSITVLYSLFLYALDLMFITWLGLLSWGIVIVGIVLAIINFRDKINGGFISFGKAFSIGFLIILIYAIISIIYYYVLTTFIDPQIPERMMQMAQEKLMSKGLSDEMIDQQVQMQEKFMTGSLKYVGILIQLFSMVLIGTIISLFCALILKKQDDSFKATFSE